MEGRDRMRQDEKWHVRYQEVIGFIEANHRNPSRHRIEEHDHLNWLKANRKVMNAGRMKPRGWRSLENFWKWWNDIGFVSAKQI